MFAGKPRELARGVLLARFFLEHLLEMSSPGEGFNDWGGRGYEDFVPGEVTKKVPFGDETT